MKIKSITLNNYRLYKGENRIDFDIEGNKNIFLISGQNGFGKTTFLHSLLWCLYGRMMVEIDDSIRKDVNLRGGYAYLLQYNLNTVTKQELDSLLGQLDGNKKNPEVVKNSSYSVTIEFSDVVIPSIPCRNLLIRRSYNVITKKENVEIKIDGADNELSQGIGNDVFINDFILNKDIARFFFFDSERIVALAETSTLEEKRKLNSAYNEVLGVKKYEDLRNNLENLRFRFRKKSSDISAREKLVALLAKQKSFENDSENYNSQIKKLEDELVILKSRDGELQIQLIKEGNSTSLEELRRLEGVVEVTRKNDIQYKTQMKGFLDFAPFAIAGSLLQKTKRQIDKDYQIGKSNLNVANQNALLSDISSDLLIMIEKQKLNSSLSIELQQQIQDVLQKYKAVECSGQQLITVNKDDYQEFVAIYNNITTTYKSEFERLAEDYKKNKQTLERSSRRISNMQTKEKDQVIQNIRKQKNEVEEAIAAAEEKIRFLYEQIGNMKRNLAIVNKQISELSKKVSLDDSDVKKDKLADSLILELDEFLTSLKREKKFSLENRIKRILNALMHKEDFIGNVKVNIVEDYLDIDLYTPEGFLIRKDVLSKGEQQLYATSILKALVEESGIEFPVFIDSPLQKFDKSHSRKIITEFYPTISKQVILFPLLHKELTEDELEVMKPLVNSTYVIQNEASHSFFRKIDVNHLMSL